MLPCETAPAIATEVIVVDNASRMAAPRRRRSARAGDRVAEQSLLRRRQQRGIRASRVKTTLLLLNSDTLVPAGAIETLLGQLDRYRDVAVVGPACVDGAGKPELSFGR